MIFSVPTRNKAAREKAAALGLLLAGGMLVLPAAAQPVSTAKAVSAVDKPGRNLPNHLPRRASMYYGSYWGIDTLSVKAVESGEIIRFSYRVLDADKAKPLNDKKVQPALIDMRAGVSLVVPSLEQVGQLRQTAAPEAGKSYWMAFSNRGRFVKRGDRVTVVIGPFRAVGLVVE